MINFRQMEIFRAVMEVGTTSGAAELLSISQPAVSNMIRHTEDHLGFQLFKREHGRLWPTREAEQLYDETEPLFTMFSTVQLKADDLRDAKVGSIHIVATPSIGLSLIPGALRRFLAERPDVRVSVDTRGTEQIAEHIDSRRAEVGVLMEPLKHPSLTAMPIHMGTMACVMAYDHPLAEKDTIRPKDLGKHLFIALGRNTTLGTLVERAFKASGQPYAWQIETRYCNSACAIAAETGGITVVDPYTISQISSEDVVIRPFLPAIEVSAYVVHSAFRPISNLAKAFISDLEASLV